MARRRKDGEWIEAIVGLFGILFLLGLVSPTFRAVTIGIGRLLPLILFAAVAVLVLYKFLRKSRSSENAFDSGYTSATNGLSTMPASAPELTETPVNLIAHLRNIDWFQFEKLVELMYRKLGYSVTRRGGANPDGGIDLIIEKDGFKTAIQCKHWMKWNVGVGAVREFLGALKDADMQSGIFITLNGYTGEAKNLAERHGIQIINETGLAEMLESVAASSDTEIVSLLNDKRKFCPKCESEMRLKTARTGPNAGKEFWACSRFPKCWFKMKVS